MRAGKPGKRHAAAQLVVLQQAAEHFKHGLASLFIANAWHQQAILTIAQHFPHRAHIGRERDATKLVAFGDDQGGALPA